MNARMKFDHCPQDLLDRPAESLVVRGFRCWMAGYEFGDIDCWETAWREYSDVLGPRDARAVLSDLQFWIRTLREVSARPVSCFPHCCRHLCHDECMVLSLVSAHQRQDLGAARAAAHHLSGLHNGRELAALIDASGDFACALADAGQHLIPVNIAVVESIAAQDFNRDEAKHVKH